jgi:Tol biopolymer transport system component
MWGCARLSLLVALAGLVLVGSADASASPGTTERVSVDSAGVQGDGPSEYPAISADGRYVAFHSSATTLVSGDTNGIRDVFVHDRETGFTERVSISSGGVQGTSDSLSPAINSDGRYVAFQSFANNLVSGDTALCGTPPVTFSCPDIFVRDRQTSTTERVSLSSAEVQANGESWSPAINGDGRYVAFYSEATNLVSGDTNNVEDIFVRDRQPGTTVRVSLASDGTQANGASDGWLAISSDGRFVAFTSDATNLVTGDTNAVGDVFLRDRDTDADGIFDEAGAVFTTRVSVDSTGAQSNGESYFAAISADGGLVAFGSEASNLVAGDTNVACDNDGDTQYDDNCPDIFVRDRQAGTTNRVSLDSAGGQANAGSFAPAISGNGRYVAFHSLASNLVVGDSNGQGDVFVRDRLMPSTTRVSVDNGGGEGNGESLDPAISGDGHSVAFDSSASNLVTGDTNGRQDVFVRERLMPVGGIADLPDVSGPSNPDYLPLAGLTAAALVLLAAGVCYAGKRLRQG